MTPYLTVDDAQMYFDDRLNTSPWDDSSDIDKLKALKQATRLINNLRFIGYKTDVSQDNEFPRGGDALPPRVIQEATCELALQLLDDVDPNLEIENLSTNHQSYSTVRTAYDRSFVLPHIAAGIPSAEAWALLLPYLADPLSVTLVRK